MAIVATYGPPDKSIVAAYRPVLVMAQDDGGTGTPPEVYCDVYLFNPLVAGYYKTISSNIPVLAIGAATFWQFDLSGLAQEFIETMVYDLTLVTLGEVYGSDYQYGQTVVFFRIRISTEDSFGVITPEGPLPVQASYGIPPMGGGGYISDQEFWMVNATLQIQDSQDLLSMLQAFQVTGVFDADGRNVDSNYHVYQLSYKKRDSIYLSDYGQFALLTTHLAFSGVSTKSVSIAFFGYAADGTLVYGAALPTVTMQSNFIYTLPTGIPNLVTMFPLLGPFIATIVYYRVVLYDPVQYLASLKCIYATPKITIIRKDGLIQGITYLLTIAGGTPRHTRIWYKNYLGQFDYLNFVEREEVLKTSSQSYETPVTVIPDGYNTPLNQWNRSNQSRAKYSVRSSETNTVTGLFTESDIPLLKQLFACTQAFLEMRSPEGGGDPPPVVLVPIVITDNTFPTQVFEGREEYRISLQYIPSNENIIVR